MPQALVSLLRSEGWNAFVLEFSHVLHSGDQRSCASAAFLGAIKKIARVKHVPLPIVILKRMQVDGERTFIGVEQGFPKITIGALRRIAGRDTQLMILVAVAHWSNTGKICPRRK